MKKINVRSVLVLLLVATLVIVLVSAVLFVQKPSADEPGVFVGMDVAYGGEEAAITLIDNISGYVNLVILGSLNLTTNTPALTRVCQHLYEKNLYFIVYVAFARVGNYPPQGPNPDFFTTAQEQWGTRFLGVYLFDEVGGRVIDRAHSVKLDNASDYSEAADSYVNQLHHYLANVSGYYSPAKFNLLCSDYALYWYDYLGGYDTIFAEYLPRQNLQVPTALCRGAAKTLDKEWGAIITYSSNSSVQFSENPQLIYDDMVFAYQNGAKYIVVFNSLENQTQQQYGGLTADHLVKMREFWAYLQGAPNKQASADTAYVLPKDYGYGFRGPDDRIWGKWSADSLSAPLWTDLSNKLSAYGSGLDVVYETKVNNETVSLPYQKLVFWNVTVIEK